MSDENTTEMKTAPNGVPNGVVNGTASGDLHDGEKPTAATDGHKADETVSNKKKHKHRGKPVPTVDTAPPATGAAEAPASIDTDTPESTAPSQASTSIEASSTPQEPVELLPQETTTPEETAQVEPPQEATAPQEAPAPAAPPQEATAPEREAPAEDLRLRTKVWTNPATGKRYLMPTAFMRDVVNGQPVSDVMYAYAMRDDDTQLVTLTAREWNALPFFYFKEDGPAPRATARPVDVVPGRRRTRGAR